MTKELRSRLKALGYRLQRNYRCRIRQRVMPYATLPLGAGPTCVHNSLADVAEHVRKVEQIREWQRELLPMAGEQV